MKPGRGKHICYWLDLRKDHEKLAVVFPIVAGIKAVIISMRAAQTVELWSYREDVEESVSRRSFQGHENLINTGERAEPHGMMGDELALGTPQILAWQDLAQFY